MELLEFRMYLEKQKTDFLNRCKLINEIMTTNKPWSYIIRALLFCSNNRVIAKSYILQKVNFMLRHPDNLEEFLDYARMTVFIALSTYLQK